MKPWLLKCHRWLALVFALPLLVVIGTGIILAFEPITVMSAIKPGTLTADKIGQALARHDASGQARVLTHRSYEGTLTIAVGRGGGIRVDTANGGFVDKSGVWAEVLLTSRRLHETLLLDMTWLVIASSFVMLALTALGVLMGWPRLSNTLSGWHKGLAWGLLPLLVLSPLTGLFLAYGITFASPPSQSAGASAQLRLGDAVRVAGAKHDLSGLVWLRPQGGSMAMRIVEGGEYRVYSVTAEGTTLRPRNWPRLWHEGNFGGIVSALPNVVAGLAAMALLITGIWIWAGRQLRLRARRAARVVEPA